MSATDAPEIVGDPYLFGDVRVTLAMVGTSEVRTLLNDEPFYARTVYITYRTNVDETGYYLQDVAVIGVYVHRTGNEPEVLTDLKLRREFPAPNLRDLPPWLMPLIRQYEPAPLTLTVKRAVTS